MDAPINLTPGASPESARHARTELGNGIRHVKDAATGEIKNLRARGRRLASLPWWVLLWVTWSDAGASQGHARNARAAANGVAGAAARRGLRGLAGTGAGSQPHAIQVAVERHTGPGGRFGGRDRHDVRRGHCGEPGYATAHDRDLCVTGLFLRAGDRCRHLPQASATAPATTVCQASPGVAAGPTAAGHAAFGSGGPTTTGGAGIQRTRAADPAGPAARRRGCSCGRRWTQKALARPLATRRGVRRDDFHAALLSGSCWAGPPAATWGGSCSVSWRPR